MSNVSPHQMQIDPDSPWLYAVLDVALFLAGWLGFVAVFHSVSALDLVFLLGALLLPSAVVIWWGLGWAHAQAASEASVRSAVLQGSLWGLLMSVLVTLVVVIFSSNLSVAHLVNAEILRDLSVALACLVSFSVAASVATALVLHAANSVLHKARANPSIERTLPGKPVSASHVKR